MDLILTSISGVSERCVIVITAGECVSFGRTKSAHNVFAMDRTMSSVHFEIEHSAKASVVRDKASSNGTWLNSKRIAQEILKSGDRIRAGLTTFEVQFRRNIIKAHAVNYSDPEPTVDRHPPIESIAALPKTSLRPSPTCDSRLLPHSNVTDEIRHQLPEFGVFKKKLSAKAEAGIPIIVDRVSREWSVYVVIHPLKIRQRIPEGNFTVLWGFHGSQFSKFGPVAMPWAEFKKTQIAFLSRLIAADAIIFFAGRNAEEVANRLEELGSVELTGFSESNGLLPIAWPSSLVTMLDVKGASGCQQLFDSSIAGAIFASPWDEQTVLCACTKEFGDSLSEFSFSSVSRVFD